MNAPPPPPPNPVPTLTSWKILKSSGQEERITALGLNVLSDGSIAFMDQHGPIVVFNARKWDSVTRSSIQPAQQGNT